MAFRPSPRNVIRNRLKGVLDKYRLSYADLAREIGCSRDYISKVIQAKRPLTEDFIARILERLFDKQRR